MKYITVVIVLLALGAGGAFAYLKFAKQPENKTAPNTELVSPAQLDPSIEHGESTSSAASMLHGGTADAAQPTCAKHKIPAALCGFCNPKLIEELGFCHGHGVPEAFCTRCSPLLIAAFKAENDWCAEHGLPESQCATCNPDLNKKPAG